MAGPSLRWAAGLGHGPFLPRPMERVGSLAAAAERGRRPWMLAAAASAAALGAAVAVAAGRETTLGLGVVALSLVPLLAVAVGGLKRLLVAAALFDISLGIDAHFFYVEPLGDLGALGGLNVSVTTLALACLYAAWLAEALLTPWRATRPRLAGTTWALAYVGAVAVAALAATNAMLAGFELALLAQMLLLLVYLVSHLRGREDIVFAFWVLFVSAIVQSAVTVFTAVTHVIVHVGPISNAIDRSYMTGAIWRAGGTMGAPNLASSFFAMLAAPALALVLTQRRSAFTTLAYATLVCSLVALVVTRSRGGWLAFIVAAAIVVAVLALRGTLSTRGLLTTLAAGALLAPLVVPVVLDRLQAYDGGALASRAPLSQMSWRMVQDHPLLGVGPNNFAAVAPEYLTPDLSREWLYTVHNKYLLVWSESGSIALLAFLMFVLRGAWSAVAAVRGGDGLSSPLALGLGAGVIGHMAHMGYDIFNSRPVVQLLWVCIALLAVLARGRVQVAAPRFRRAVAQALAPRPTYAAVPRAGGPLG